MTLSPPQQRTTIGLANLIPTVASVEREPINKALAGPSPVTLTLASHLLARAASGGTLAPDE
ncbi:hypothetical protein AB0I28_32095 [Phytomonospora sp. NPDC050363]|uniref:hypothetical protein n=1 Tax=Phytomonospora sp. NPDC050363 TaxID=3155642 RepID=UPI0033D3A666